AEVTGHGPPLVLVPGGLTGWISWEPHAKHLSNTRTVVRAQLLSVQYGLEDRPLPPDYSTKTESRALAETLDELGLTSNLDIAAWSYGALVALDYALDHQDRVRTLTLIEPPAFWVLKASGGLDAEAQEVAETLGSFGGDISEDDLERFACAVGLCRPGQSPRALPQWPVWMRHRRSLRNCSAPLTHADDPARLRAFQHPVLLVKGTGSAQFLHQSIDALAALLPQGRVIEMPGGHAPHIVSMDRFLEQLTSFLSLEAKAA
ncbi:MAG: alpha/beta hydrolase, partial [Chloroflexi bacterium]|nr:alpha/beta hydrolase [Chloroflexota bacterium]